MEYVHVVKVKVHGQFNMVFNFVCIVVYLINQEMENAKIVKELVEYFKILTNANVKELKNVDGVMGVVITQIGKVQQTVVSVEEVVVLMILVCGKVVNLEMVYAYIVNEIKTFLYEGKMN